MTYIRVGEEREMGKTKLKKVTNPSPLSDFPAIGEKKSDDHDQGEIEDTRIASLWENPKIPFSFSSADTFYRGLQNLKLKNIPRYAQVVKLLMKIPSYVIHLRKRKIKLTRHVNYTGMGTGHQFMMDLAEMPTTDSGYNYFLVLCDELDNYIYTAAMKRKTSSEFQEVFDKIIKANGLNEIDSIGCDSGSEFLGSKTYFKTKGVKLFFMGNKNKGFEVCEKRDQFL